VMKGGCADWNGAVAEFPTLTRVVGAGFDLPPLSDYRIVLG
jgi:hypothetical protein